MQIICNNDMRSREMRKKNFIITSLLSVAVYTMFFVPVWAIEDHDEHAELFNAPKVLNGSVLSVKDCVALAFRNSPNIRQKNMNLI